MVIGEEIGGCVRMWVCFGYFCYLCIRGSRKKEGGWVVFILVVIFGYSTRERGVYLCAYF